ncbi:MAG TPA: TonB-dependent receptor plug domain-containing protein, partial [Flavisolibacter sp.]|nr:TonB-dependent receptor plug domain-containing protein [Flavisolibacter sp.]
MKKTLLSAWILLFISMPFWALSQSRQITGIVSDEKGAPLSGASVLQKGTTNGTTTDDRGSYTLTVTGVSPVLVFSFAGRQSQEMAVGTGANYNVSLSSSGAMSEVIVTALGIRKEKRSLGYTVQSVNAEDLTVNHQSNVVNALQGKVAGVTISSTGGAPGQGARIQIRGINSLDAGRNNQPIFIVDGVEVDNSTFTTGGGDTRGMTNRAADINPDDIESISVLRGGAATALYGIRAANGAVLITTKSARAGKIQVSYTGSYGFDNVNKTPDVQTKFTQGYLGVYDNTSFWPSWGPTVAEGKAQDPTHPDQIFNNFKRAYRQGNQTRHSINLGGGSEMMQLGASFSYSNQQGVIPFSDYKSYNARVNGNLNVSKKIKIGASMNFINSGGSRVNSDRYGEQLIYWSPRWDVMDY